MATKAAVREDRFTPYAVGLTIALVLVGTVWSYGAGDTDRPDPFLPALLLALNGLLMAVRPAAYFGMFAPQWAFKDRQRGEPSRAWLVTNRLAGAVAVLVAVFAVVVSRQEPGPTCELRVPDGAGGYTVEDCSNGLQPGGSDGSDGMYGR